jgi:glycosyltransferase involved in cell wall biosynthesis
VIGLLQPEQAPRVSVIIPVFNQPLELAQCLAALERQTYPADLFEAVVVDNGSDQPLDDVTRRFAFVRAVREPTRGSYAARNAGILASRGEVLAFTDADCLPSADWLERGVTAVRSLPGPGMVAGKIELTFPDPDKRTAAELFEMVLGFPQQQFLVWGFGATANLFTTRETVDLVGLFNHRLMSGGDMDWGQRLRGHGLPQEYGANVRITHPARRTLRQLWTKSLRVAGGFQQVAEQRGEGISGCLTNAFHQLVLMRHIRAHIADPRLGTIERRCKFAALVWLVELLRLCERYRVHWGGRPSRL